MSAAGWGISVVALVGLVAAVVLAAIDFGVDLVGQRRASRGPRRRFRSGYNPEPLQAIVRDFNARERSLARERALREAWQHDPVTLRQAHKRHGTGRKDLTKESVHRSTHRDRLESD